MPQKINADKESDEGLNPDLDNQSQSQQRSTASKECKIK